MAFERDIQPQYVSPGAITAAALSAPALETNPDWNIQIEKVVAAQNAIVPEDLAAMQREQEASIHLVTAALSDDFVPDKLPKTYALLRNVFNDTALVTGPIKAHWQTRRPYIAAPDRVKLLIEPVRYSAYPSGHATLSYTLAQTLGLLFPHKSEMLYEYAKDIARHRVQAGVHAPQDIRGGRTLGKMITDTIVKHDAFQRAIHEAQTEINNHGI